MQKYLRATNSAGALLTHGTRSLCVAIIAACIGFAPEARAITFTGSTTAAFANPTGAPGMVTNFIYNPNGNRVFEWGTPISGSASSAVGFVPTTFAGVSTDQYFKLGDLAYRNGEVYAGTEANSVDLLTYLNFTSPSGITGRYNFSLKLINTPNTGNPAASADTVLLSAYFPTTFFTSGGINYSLNIGLGTLNGFDPTNALTVPEGGFAMKQIVGKITAQAVPDSGSSLALMAIALVGLSGLRRYVTCKA
jgi:hypothetical protein